MTGSTDDEAAARAGAAMAGAAGGPDVEEPKFLEEPPTS